MRYSRGETCTHEEGGRDVQHVLIRQSGISIDQTTVKVLWPKSEPTPAKGDHLVIRGERFRVIEWPWVRHNTPSHYGAEFEATWTYYRAEMELVEAASYERDQWGGLRPIETTTPARGRIILDRSELGWEARADVTSKTIDVELEPGVWRDGFTSILYGGDRYDIVHVEQAGEIVVVEAVGK